MRVDVIPINELSESMKQDWLRMSIQSKSQEPFFSSDFFLSVGKYYPVFVWPFCTKRMILRVFYRFTKDHRLIGSRAD